MNPNEIQALLNQSVQHSQQLMLGALLIQIALLIVGAWVIYMFYARLRDIADELRKIRVTYEMEQDRTTRNAARPRAESSAGNPFCSDARYMPPK
jgi:hypothetical protein